MERLRILEDAKQLKFLAAAFLHPEKPVEVDGTACARCYFDRPSAPEQETVGEANYRAMVLADTVALRQAAVDYMHPELGVVTSDGTATARCYFDRPSAPEQESYEEAEERAAILADALALKKLAVDYMHPELGVVTSDGTATARCYFDRASAPEQESYDEAEERAMVLADALALKKLAVDYMHPELGVVTSDGTATARCYFDRPSAPEQESYEQAEERAMVLADAIALKKLAVDYMHPEIGVVTSDTTSTARCYFDRASAPEQESYEDAEERAAILADALALKKLAVDYMHPEIGVVASDGTATARCYFDRFSASRDSEPTTRNTSQKQQKTAKTLPPTGTATTSSPVVAKHVVTKTITSQIMESTIKKSASTVELYGLDMDHGDDFY